MLALYIVLFLIFAVFLTSFICFMMVFYSPNRKVLGPDEYEMLEGEIYEPYHESMRGWMKQLREMPHGEFEIKSFDGLSLRGKYYETQKGAPIELMFHGYKGNAERDLCGGVFRAFALGHNAFIIDHRASGQSEGNVITFGVNEYKDCLRWVDFAISQFGADVELILTGISMGAATVMTAAGFELPENVKFVLADCGYSTAKDIIKKVIRDMKMPDNILYPFVKLGARIFGNFDLEEVSPLESMKKCKVPVIFYHGDTDDFVPCYMSRELYDACTNKKRIEIISGAGHGLCYPKSKDQYLNAAREFENEIDRKNPA